MSHIICVTCEMGMRCIENDIILVKVRTNTDAIEGLHHADLWKCQKCDVEVITGMSYLPFAVPRIDDVVGVLEREKQSRPKTTIKYISQY